MLKRILFFGLDVVIGCAAWGVSVGYVYLAYSRFSSLPGDLGAFGSVLWLLAMVGVPCVLGSLLLKYSVRGIGRLHYAFGSRGWMLRFFLVLLLLLTFMIPGFAFLDGYSFRPDQLLCLSIIWLTGRGLRRSLRGELEIVAVSS